MRVNSLGTPISASCQLVDILIYLCVCELSFNGLRIRFLTLVHSCDFHFLLIRRLAARALLRFYRRGLCACRCDNQITLVIAIGC